VREYPEVNIEITIDHVLTDIVAEGFDAGVRLGERLARDMIAVRIGPDLRMIVVGSPAYFAGRSKPKTPHDLTEHNCVNLRLPTHGGLYAWEFEKNGRVQNVRVEGQLIFNSTSQTLQAALSGLGLAMVMEDTVRSHIAAGELEQVLADWSQPFEGYHLYYPSRRHAAPAFAAFVKAMRHS
jgi:DNA-binding transcriptional LysR family regulator